MKAISYTIHAELTVEEYEALMNAVKGLELEIKEDIRETKADKENDLPYWGRDYDAIIRQLEESKQTVHSAYKKMQNAVKETTVELY